VLRSATYRRARACRAPRRTSGWTGATAQVIDVTPAPTQSASESSVTATVTPMSNNIHHVNASIELGKRRPPSQRRSDSSIFGRPQPRPDELRSRRRPSDDVASRRDRRRASGASHDRPGLSYIDDARAGAAVGGTTGEGAERVTDSERPEGEFDIAKRFATWLNEGLNARGISQRYLAVRSGVSHSTISRLLSGEREPTLDTANRLAIVLGWDSLLDALH
jgi:DNA-binding XRE family transcriptional regulator